MSLTNPNKVITEERLSEFYQSIFPYLGGMPEILANKFNKSDLYSTSEKMIGQWVDGKPIYQKTFNFGEVTFSTPSARTYYDLQDVTSLSIDKMIKMVGCILESTTWKQLNYADGAANGGYMSYAYTSPKLRVLCQGFTKATMIETIQYTKTTDSPVSVGNDTDYSTTEKIVGTWIDGKPIYQKTVSTTISAVNDWTNIAHNISNLSNCVKAFGTIANAAGYWIIGGYRDSNTYSHILVDGVNAKVFLGNQPSFVNETMYVTIQYTKTTD